MHDHWRQESINCAWLSSWFPNCHYNFILSTVFIIIFLFGCENDDNYYCLLLLLHFCCCCCCRILLYLQARLILATMRQQFAGMKFLDLSECEENCWHITGTAKKAILILLQQKRFYGNHACYKIIIKKQKLSITKR